MIYAAWFDLHNDDVVVAHPTALRVYAVLVRDPFAFMYARPVKGWYVAEQLRADKDAVNAALNLLVERGYVFEHGRGPNNVRMLSLAADRGVRHQLEPEARAEEELARVRNRAAAVRASGANRRAREQSADGRHTKEDIRRIYDGQTGLCYYCGSALDGIYHVDHKLPLARGGSNWPENLCCACVSCNLRKHTMTDVEFAALIGIRQKPDASSAA